MYVHRVSAQDPRHVVRDGRFLPNLQKLIEQATPGPWEYDGDGNVTTPYQEPVAETAVLGDAHLIAAAPDIAAQITQDEAAFAEIAKQQQKAFAIARTNGFVFDDIGRDPGNWQHLAFTYYTMLCEIDSIARAALARLADFDRSIG